MPDKIGLMKLCCAGDLLFTTPAIRAIRQAFPDSHISYITGKYSRFIADNNPHIDTTIQVPTPFDSVNKIISMLSIPRILRILRGNDFDIIISFHRSKIIAALARYGSSAEILSFSTARPFVHRWIDFDAGEHESKRYLDLVSKIGARPDGLELEYQTTQKDDATAENLLEANGISKPFAVIIPGGGINPGSTMLIKRWPAIRYKIISEYLRQRTGMVVVAAGSQQEKDLAQQIAPDLNLAGQTTFPVLASILKKAEIVVGNDSGPLYLASAVGTKTVGIYGPSSPELVAPISTQHRSCVSKVYCHPCYHPSKVVRGFITCPTGNWSCMLTLRPEDVISQIDGLLGIA